MNILVCGSEGFLGCVLWHELKTHGHAVRGFDRGLYGIRNTDDARFTHPDAVINLAALVGEPVCMANPTLTMDYNVTFAVEQAQEAIRLKVPTYVQISTCSVYGERSPDEVVTTSTPLADADSLPPYARSKVLVERALMGLDWDCTALRIVRLGTLCGASKRMRFDLMANGFCLSAARSRKVVIYNPGSIRPHVSVGSTARMLRWLVEHPDDAETLSTYVGGQHTVSELAQVAARAARSSVEVDSSKAADDRRSYRVRCSPWMEHIPDGVYGAMDRVTKELLSYRWAGATTYSPMWGNTGWRWEDEP